MHGYEMISELAERTGGAWRPSPGSVYPTLQALEDEGLVSVQADGGKRLFVLSDLGRRTTTEPDTPAPWTELDTTAPEDTPDDLTLREATGQLIGALDQVLVAGTPQQKTRAAEAVHEARRSVYRILSGDN
jgi:DNA-binding PadR family transcriptional regulator